LTAPTPHGTKARRFGFNVWSGARADIDRVWQIWRECLAAYNGPHLFGAPTMAGAMYAPVVTRFLTYEPDELEELEMEF
jgi:glutathione S-transferase